MGLSSFLFGLGSIFCSNLVGHCLLNQSCEVLWELHGRSKSQRRPDHRTNSVPFLLNLKISGLPARFLPRPPSPKRKTPRHSPSPLVDLRRSPSPTELLKMMTMTAPLSDPRPPSPPQVVPQMNRPPSPLEMFHKINNSVGESCNGLTAE